MDKKQNQLREEREEEFITQQISESYQSGLIEPEKDQRANENKSSR